MHVPIGTSVDEVIEGLAAVTAEKVFGKFFHMRPQSNMRLGQWLDSWIKIGKTAHLLNANIATMTETVRTETVIDQLL